LRDKLRAAWRSLQGATTRTGCRQLNPIIRGWASYYRVVAATRAFPNVDHWMFIRECRWVKHRHPGKPRGWCTRRYWGTLNPARKDTWVFGDKRSGVYVLKFAWSTRRHHILIKGRASPDDPELREYWHRRQAAKAADLRASGQRLASNQEYRCVVCQESLFNGEALRTHDLRPTADRRRRDEKALRLVHLLCQQQLQRACTEAASASEDEERDKAGLSVSA